MTDAEHLILCLEIISGAKDIVGTYPGDDYGVKDAEDGSKFSIMEFFKEIDSRQDKIEEKDEELNDIYKKFAFVLSELDEWKIRDINYEYQQEYGEELFDVPPRTDFQVYLENTHKNDTCGSITAVESFLSRMQDTEEHSTSDYGWLAPDGTFYDVEWGMHSQWAREYCEEHYPFNEHADMYWKTNENGTKRHFVNGDFLVYVLHWVLVDSPYQGLATPKYDPAFGMTKAQKEFMYDYYIERNRHKEANEIWSNED